MKKNKQITNFPDKAGMIMTGKKNARGWDTAYLFVNGKTDRTEYEMQDELFTGGTHGVNFTKEILKLKCNGVPGNIYATLSFDNLLLKNNFFCGEETVRITKEKNTLVMYFYFEGGQECTYKFLCLNTEIMEEHMQKSLSTKKSGIYFEANQMDYVPMMNGKPGETLHDLLNRLVKAVDIEMKKVKDLLLKELIQAKKEVERNTIEWTR